MTKKVRYGLPKDLQGHYNVSEDVIITKEVGNTYLEGGY